MHVNRLENVSGMHLVLQHVGATAFGMSGYIIWMSVSCSLCCFYKIFCSVCRGEAICLLHV